MITAALLIFTTYLVYILCKVGIIRLPSLSDSFYQLKKQGWLFQLSLGVTAMLLVPVMIEVTPEPFKVIGFFVPSALIFTAFAPKFGKIWNEQQKKMIPENELERKVHQTSATYSAIASFIWVIIMAIATNWLLLLTIPICSIIAFAMYLKWKQKIFFAEMACFGWVFLTLYLIS